jgi:acetolactate synthase I/II/III large subunit
VTRSGGQILVDQLVLHGADVAFGVPGESYLPVLDALHDAPVRLISTRHEAGAANMAEAYGKLTGRPGICLVTRGPGATHASVGVHTAFQDSTPMLLLVGQVARGTTGREGFQEVDYRQFFGPLAKWVAQVEEAARLPEVMARAFSIACSGRPGPVVVALPEDMLSETADVRDARRVPVASPSPGAAGLARLAELLATADRPLIVAGEGGWTARAGTDLLAFASAARIPVATSFRCQDYVDNDAGVYAGHAGIGMAPALSRRIADADVLVAVGGRLGDIPSSGYSLLEIPNPRQQLVHVHPDPDELGAVYQPALSIVSGLEAFGAAARGLDVSAGAALRDELVAQARAEYEANLNDHRELPGKLQLAEVMKTLRARLRPEAILTCGAGNFTVWAHRFAEFTQYGTQVCPRSGSMGYGVAAAVAAKLVHPEQIAVCFTGDGDFVMSSPEFATAVQYELPIVVLLVNNGMYATIRMHQERLFPGRVVGTSLENPDFPALAEAYGGYGERVESTEGFGAAFERALASGKPALLELPVDPERISPRIKLSDLQKGTG